MRNENPEFRIFRKEWRARARMFAVFGGVMLLMLAYMLGAQYPNALPLGVFSVIAFAALGVRLFPADEADPARSFIYQLPISRRRLLAVKLAALATQVGALLIIPILLICVVLLHDASLVYSQGQHSILYDIHLQLVLVTAGSSFAVALLAAIVSLHMRSAIVAIVVTLALAVVLGWLILLPDFLGKFTMVDQRTGLTTLISNFGWIVAKLLLAAAVLTGWLFFLFCRTPIQEAGPTPRGLLVFVFAAGAVEVFYTLFYTGWRDLAYLIFGL